MTEIIAPEVAPEVEGGLIEARSAAAMGGTLNGQRFLAAVGKTALRGGESEAAAYGREMHGAWDYGKGFRKEFTGIKGMRPDAVNLKTKEIVELKPDSPGAIRRGKAQLQKYKAALEAKYGCCFTVRLETYPRWKK